MTSYLEYGVDPTGINISDLLELFIQTRDAKSQDVGAMAHIFIKCFNYDKTAQLLYNHDQIWPEVIEMLRTYLNDDYTHVILAWDAYTDTIVGWTSVSLVDTGQDDYFKYCDSTVWAGRQLLRRETGAAGHGPMHIDQMKRAALMTLLRLKNRDGQHNHVGHHRLVVNTIAIHPDVIEHEIPQIAYNLMNDARELAKAQDLPLWAQLPHASLGDPEDILDEIGFDIVGSFQLDLNRYANEEQLRRGNWGFRSGRNGYCEGEIGDRGDVFKRMVE